MRLRVTRYGEPVLRQPGQTVTDFGDALHQLVIDMKETMYAEEGVGLAAQQVGKDLQVCIVDVSHLPSEELEYQLDGLRQPIELIMPMTLVNPELLELPGRVIPGEEGCLSFPGIRGDVPRAEAIDVRFRDPDGREHFLHCRGWFARVVQHEVDHLHGRLFIDRMNKRQLRQLQGPLRQLENETRKALEPASRNL